jgi:tRNA modification GTPase
MDTAQQASGETIAAIATPPGVGGVGIVRVSGQDAFAIGREYSGQRLGAPRPVSHLLTYGAVVDLATDEPLDDVLIAFARHTATGEDTVEINAHGGPLAPAHSRRELALGRAPPAGG